MGERQFFKSLNLTSDLNRNAEIAKTHEHYMGSGRIVIPINDKWVIKIAYNESGLQQNFTEIKVWNYANRKERSVLARVRRLYNSWERDYAILQRFYVARYKGYHPNYLKVKDLFADFKIATGDLDQIGYIDGKLKYFDYGKIN